MVYLEDIGSMAAPWLPGLWQRFIARKPIRPLNCLQARRPLPGRQVKYQRLCEPVAWAAVLLFATGPFCGDSRYCAICCHFRLALAGLA